MVRYCERFWAIADERMVAVVSGICITLALAIPLSCSVASATRLFSSRRESVSPFEKKRRRVLIAHWFLLLITTLAYTLPIIVDVVTHEGFSIRNESESNPTDMHPKYACSDFTVNWWRPRGFTHVFWSINLLVADAVLLYVTNRSRGAVPKGVLYALGILYFLCVGFPLGGFSQLFLILLELSCTGILLARYVNDRLAARKGKSPEHLQETRPVALPILLAVIAYAITRILYIFVIYPLGGTDIWADPMIFITAAVMQHAHIGTAAEEEPSESGSGYLIVTDENIPPSFAADTE